MASVLLSPAWQLSTWRHAESAGAGPRWALLGDPGLRGVSSRSFPVFWRRLQPGERQQKAVCFTNHHIKMKMSPRLLLSFRTSWMDPLTLLRAPEGTGGPRPVAGSPFIAVLSPGPAGALQATLPLPAIQSRILGAISASQGQRARACVRVCVCVCVCLVFSFLLS